MTQAIGHFAAEMRGRTLPPTLAATVRMGVVDCFAVMIAGWTEPSTRSVRAIVSSADVSSQTSAAVLGTAAHALDYDDTAFGNHPSAVLVPALLAAALDRAISGKAMLTAYAVGYEVWADLAARETDSLHAKGWHPSAVLGPVGAAAAVACGWGMDAGQAAAAVSISSSFCGGVVANFGSTAKPFHIGRAAQSGIVSAQLAREGMAGAPDVLEHDHGLLRALSPRGLVDVSVPASLASLSHFHRQGLNIKLSPICYAAHRICDAALMLRGNGSTRFEEIAQIDIELGATQSAILRKHRPRTPDEAKFSAEFAAVTMLLNGRCGPAELESDFINRPDVQALMARTVRHTTDAQDPAEPMHAPFDRVTLLFKDGTRLASPTVQHADGHHRRPASAARLRAKFDNCVGPHLGATETARLFDRLTGLESENDIAGLLPDFLLKSAA
jgi:2-methylcitrate dehydratase PrpD